MPPSSRTTSSTGLSDPIRTVLTKKQALFLLALLRPAYQTVQVLTPVTDLDGVKEFYDDLMTNLQAVLDA